MKLKLRISYPLLILFSLRDFGDLFIHLLVLSHTGHAMLPFLSLWYLDFGVVWSSQAKVRINNDLIHLYTPSEKNVGQGHIATFHILRLSVLSYSVGVLQVWTIEWIFYAHVCFLQWHHFALDLQCSVAHVKWHVVLLALGRVGWIAHIGFDPFYRCRPEECWDSMRHAVLLC